jgi:hypothetical protein
MVPKEKIIFVTAGLLLLLLTLSGCPAASKPKSRQD